MSARPAIERASANDLMQRRFAPTPAARQIGVLLVLDGDQEPGPGGLRAVLATRVPGVARLRQHLVDVPLGCGRPVWVDDPAFDVDRHLTAAVCPPPGDERALLDLVASTVAEPLADDRPLWRVTLVHGLADGRVGLVVVVDHVMVDGIGGLVALARLVDGAATGSERGFPRPVPSPTMLLIDASRSRLRALRRAWPAVRRATTAVRQLRAGMTGRTPRCSFNQPTGPTRRLGVAWADLEAIRATAQAGGGTINDLALAVVTGALHDHLLERGEAAERLVVSVPVAARDPEGGDRYGNRSSVVPLSLPAVGDTGSRIAEVGAITGSLRAGERGVTGSVLAPVVRLLGALGVVAWYIDRQRRVNTFVTNLRGPDTRLHLAGLRVDELVAVNAIGGNVTVAFGVLSYAGTLSLSVVTDGEHGPDVERLTARVQEQLDRCAGGS